MALIKRLNDHLCSIFYLSLTLLSYDSMCCIAGYTSNFVKPGDDKKENSVILELKDYNMLKFEIHCVVHLLQPNDN